MDKGVPLRVKLTLTFLILAALVAGVGTYDVLSIKNINKSYASLLDGNVAQMDALNTLKLETLQLEDSVTVASGVTPTEKRAYVSQAAERVQDSVAVYEKSEAHATPQEKALFSGAKDTIALSISDALAVFPDKPLAADKLVAQKAKVATDTDAAARQVDTVMAALRTRPDRANVAMLVDNSIRTTILMVVLAALSAVLLGVVMTSRLTQG